MQCLSEDNCRHRPRPVSKQVSLYFYIFVDFALIFLRRIGPFRTVTCYHLATAREMASHPSVHSHHKALSAIAERLPREFKGKAALNRRCAFFLKNLSFFPFCLIFLSRIFSYFDFGLFEFSTTCGDAHTYYRTGSYTPKPYKPKTVPFVRP